MRGVLLLLALTTTLLGAWHPVVALALLPRSVALILDTSRSMQDSDQQRYTLVVSQIVADLLTDGDELTVVRMPPDQLFSSRCSDGPSDRLALSSDGSDRGPFKRRLDALVSYDTGTYFASPVRTAVRALGRHPDRPRLLLIVADAGGFGPCTSVLEGELLALRRSGASVAAIHLGGDSSPFVRSRAFDLTLSARDAPDLLASVARVYQSFLGGRKVATGIARGLIRVEVAAFVREAFVVFAADGPLGAVREGPSNPEAAATDLDYRGGGGARGLDGRDREYRIVHLERPRPGWWSFEAAGLASDAAWLLIQDPGVGLRLASPPTLAAGNPAPLVVELVDEETGARISDPQLLPGLSLTAEVEGRSVALRDDGTGGDQRAGDGIFSTTIELSRLGRQEIPVLVTSDLLERHRTVEVEVVAGSWELRVTSPAEAVMGSPVELSAELEPIGAASHLRPPERLEALVEGQVLALRAVGDDRYHFAGAWVPAATGTHAVEYRASGGSPVPVVTSRVSVAGVLELGESRVTTLPPVAAHGRAVGELSLAAATVQGEFVIEITSDFTGRRRTLEIDPGDGWVPLGAEPVRVSLTTSGPRAWPLRLRTGACPQATAPGEGFSIHLRQAGGGATKTLPLALTVLPEPWWACWWLALALSAAALALGFIVYGLISPSRFMPRLGVVLSPEADLGEGFFHPIRGTRGTGSGFYRDATVFIRSDYRLSGQAPGAVARLRAQHRAIKIRPAHGARLYRQTADGDWEPVPAEESAARVGALYRHGPDGLFFELRLG